MAVVKCFEREATGVAEIMDVKAALKQEKLLSADLNAGLEFAKERLKHMLAAKVTGATLIVEGENLTVKIQPYKSNGVHFFISFVSGHHQLEQDVLVGDKLSQDHIRQQDFIEHRCRDQINPCFKQARKLLGVAPWGNVQLRQLIACNSIRFSTDCTNVDAKVFLVKPTLRFPYNNFWNIRDVLQAKCWLEQEMPEKKGLLECVSHLLKELPATDAEPYDIQWVLQGDGESLELTTENFIPTYYLIYVSGNVIKVKR